MNLDICIEHSVLPWAPIGPAAWDPVQRDPDVQERPTGSKTRAVVIYSSSVTIDKREVNYISYAGVVLGDTVISST